MDHAAEAVDVGPEVERLAADLLGRHVAVGALDHFRFAAEELAESAGRLSRQVEVDELDDIVVAEQEVVGLDVAMDPALLVQMGERRRRRPVRIAFARCYSFLWPPEMICCFRFGTLNSSSSMNAPFDVLPKSYVLMTRGMVERDADLVFVLELVDVGPRVLRPLAAAISWRTRCFRTRAGRPRSRRSRPHESDETCGSCRRFVEMQTQRGR